jgi:parallel beta-helix repeat protein
MCIKSFSRILIGIAVLHFSMAASAEKYYVSNNGDDISLGTSPRQAFKTLAKIGEVLTDGDEIYLERGSVFYESLAIDRNNIAIAGFGYGEQAIISGAKTIEGTWEKQAWNLWELELADKPSRVYGIKRNGKQLPLGRYPEKTTSPYSGYFSRYDKLLENGLVDANLLAADNFVEAEVALLPNRWYLEIYKIAAQTDSSLIFTENLEENYHAKDCGYFFIHSPLVCDEEGEWGYNSTTGKLFLNTESNPNYSRFITPGTPNLIQLTNCSGISISEIQLEYAANKAIAIDSCENITINGCTINDGGRAVFAQNSPKVTVQDCTISNMYMSGIVMLKSNEAKISNNDIENIGTQGPVHENGDQMWHFTGIYGGGSSNGLIELNRVVHCGYSAVNYAGKNNIIRKNYIDAFNELIDDGGGIYMHGGTKGNQCAGTVIEQNIVVNSMGNPGGGPTLWGKPNSASSGIYIDDKQSGITVRNNIVAHITHYGIFFKGNAAAPFRSDCIIENNILFNCETETHFEGTFRGYDHFFDGAAFRNNQIWDIDRTVPVNSEADIDFYWENGDKEAISMRSTNEKRLWDIDFSGNTIVTTKNKTISYQQQLMNEDEFNASKVSTDLEIIILSEKKAKATLLLYNKGRETKEFRLSPEISYLDLSGNKYREKVSLEPFTGLVLMED